MIIEPPRGDGRAVSRSIVSDPNVAPMHGWRHRFKTVGMEAGIPTRVLDAIQGHAPRTAAEGYGEVTIKTMVAASSGSLAWRYKRPHLVSFHSLQTLRLSDLSATTKKP